MKIEQQPTGPSESVKILSEGITVAKTLKDIAKASSGKKESFFVADLGDVIEKYKIWKETLPNVQPFYTVRCNDTTIVLRLLASLGSGFNCFSKSEISKLIQIGVEPERIFFGSPVKMSSAIKAAARDGVDLMAFDSVSELHKIKAYHPNPKLVLRLRASDSSSDAESEFGLSGVSLSEAGALLEAAAGLGLSVVGLGFHSAAGGGVDSWADALRSALALVALAESLGHAVSLLDLGGGFRLESLNERAEELTAIIEEEMGERPPLALIGEPGSMLVSGAFSMATVVTGTRETKGGGGGGRRVLYIGEGVYGLALGRILAGKKAPRPRPVKGFTKWRDWEACDLVGPTSDSLDLVSEAVVLPKLSEGDWLQFLSIGDFYQSTSGRQLDVHYFISRETWSDYKDSIPWLGKICAPVAEPTLCHSASESALPLPLALLAQVAAAAAD